MSEVPLHVVLVVLVLQAYILHPNLNPNPSTLKPTLSGYSSGVGFCLQVYASRLEALAINRALESDTTYSLNGFRKSTPTPNRQLIVYYQFTLQ